MLSIEIQINTDYMRYKEVIIIQGEATVAIIVVFQTAWSMITY